MKIMGIPVGMIQENCYIAYGEESSQALIVDPGDWADRLIELLTEKKLTPVAILLTHGHFDHIGGVEALREHYKIPVYATKAEQEVLQNTAMSMAGFTLKTDEIVSDGQELLLGGMKVKVLETPGHTPGGCCYYFPEEGALFSGDTLFCESVGRTDFPGGDMSKLVRGIREKLMTLPEEVTVYPGHMEETTIGHEKIYNPFLQ
ncbi:MAG: MBL fold metallo-hydrolase [Lachnospiraceae bacterium]|jgi:glyoxylase-like metal-dependent hydrolase (beta-lactamase superfamily II)|nr:MBL fold metallo-hydrolase [Lachnospiraceae bacterium]